MKNKKWGDNKISWILFKLIQSDNLIIANHGYSFIYITGINSTTVLIEMSLVFAMIGLPRKKNININITRDNNDEKKKKLDI